MVTCRANQLGICGGPTTCSQAATTCPEAAGCQDLDILVAFVDSEVNIVIVSSSRFLGDVKDQEPQKMLSGSNC